MMQQKSQILQDDSKKVYSNFFQLEFSPSSTIQVYSAALEPQINTAEMDPETQIQLQRENPDFLYINRRFYIPKHESLPQYDCGYFTFLDKSYQLILNFIGSVDLQSQEACGILGRLFKNMVQQLKLERIGRKFFDPHQKISFPQYGLELMRGYDIALSIIQEIVMLQIESCVKCVRSQSFLDYIQGFQNPIEDIREGIVMTSYNKKFYKFKRLVPDMNPFSTFLKKDGQEITFAEYYKTAYNLILTNKNQPLIEASVKKRGNEQIIYLIPEFCNPTGETDQMKSDFNLQKQLAKVKNSDPGEKMQQSKDFRQKLVRDCEKIFQSWNVYLKEMPIELKYRCIDSGSLLMGNNKQIPINTSKLDRETQCEMLVSPYQGKGIDRCLILFRRKGENAFNKLLLFLEQACKEMKFPINQIPRGVCIENEKNLQEWIEAINPEAQLVVLILPGQKKKGMHYDELKRYLINKCPIPSQVLLEVTANNDKGFRTIVNKLLIQITAKTQGVPYSISNIPAPFYNIPTMICGIDLYHQKRMGKQSILGFVGSVDHYFGRYTSNILLNDSDHDISTKLSIIIDSAINDFGKHNQVAPSNIIIYRDGVSRGQIDSLIDNEIPSIQNVLQRYNEKTHDKKPICISYIIVNKKINSKFYISPTDSISNLKSAENGTLIDSVVTVTESEFQLVSQQAKLGVATPTLYNIIYDDHKLKYIDDIKVLSLKLCYLYYNTTGAIKIPAPVKNAHVLSNFVGDRYDYRRPETLISAHQKLRDMYSLYFI